MVDLLQDAARCPVCDKIPNSSQEEGFSYTMIFLRCPMGHPYVCCGDNLVEAINNWNHYIEQCIQADTARRVAHVAKNAHASFCRHCQKYTPSITRFDKFEADKIHGGYSIVKHECTVCHLTKSQTEAA